MSTPHILETITERTEQLVAEKLRSTAVTIARLEPLISEAMELGHTQAVVLEAMKAGGLETSMNNLRVYLMRARKHQAKTPAQPAHAPVTDFSTDTSGGTQQSATPAPAPVMPAVPESEEFSEGNAVTHVRDSLQRAKQTATRDFSKVVKQSLRKPIK